MEQQNRLTLRSNFRTGDRPTQEDFENVFESFLNFEDDGLNIDINQNLSLEGAITLKSNSNEPATAGTIRWNGIEFEGHNGVDWGPLGGGDSPWTLDSGNLLFNTGNVGIGISSPPTDALEVDLASGSRRARLGNVAIGNGPTNLTRNNALFSHTSLRNQTNYALMQDTNGNTFINCPNSQDIVFRVNNMTHSLLTRNSFVIGATELLNGDPDYRLQLGGSAFKNDGNDSWNNTSDVRTKENIQPFNEGLELLKKVNPIRFNYNGKANTQKNLECIGISAQDIEEVFPYMIYRSKIDKEKSGIDSDELLTTNLSALKFVMINAIRELDERLAKLEQTKTKE